MESWRDSVGATATFEELLANLASFPSFRNTNLSPSEMDMYAKLLEGTGATDEVDEILRKTHERFSSVSVGTEFYAYLVALDSEKDKAYCELTTSPSRSSGYNSSCYISPERETNVEMMSIDNEEIDVDECKCHDIKYLGNPLKPEMGYNLFASLGGNVSEDHYIDLMSITEELGNDNGKSAGPQNEELEFMALIMSLCDLHATNEEDEKTMEMKS